jgi:hypothetical protein
MAKHKYYQKFKQYTLVCSDPDGTILKLLSEIRKQTIWGHSFDVIVDPESRDTLTMFVDGDGCDKIHSIEVQEVEKTYTIDLEKFKQDANNLASCEENRLICGGRDELSV